MATASLSYDYQGARVLVTGGTSGIGHAIATSFRDAGADLTITGTRNSPSDYDVDLSGMRYQQLAVENRDALYALGKTLPELDILVNNAGATSAVKDIPGADTELMAHTPMKRWGAAQEIADAVLFLTSDRASYLTGQTINVDGGFSISG